jgi:hypothetical protein
MSSKISEMTAVTNLVGTEQIPAINAALEPIRIPVSAFNVPGSYFATGEAFNQPIEASEYLTKYANWVQRQEYGDTSLAVTRMNELSEEFFTELKLPGIWSINVVVRAEASPTSTGWPNKYKMGASSSLENDENNMFILSRSGVFGTNRLLSNKSLHRYDRNNTASEDNQDFMQWTDQYFLKTHLPNVPIYVGINFFTDMQFVQTSPGVQIEGLLVDLSYSLKADYHGLAPLIEF